MAQYKDSKYAILSMDTKERELLGSFYQDGYLYTQAGNLEVYDHDWRSLATGLAISHRLYDVVRNEGYIQIGNSHDTREFACDLMRHGWHHHGCVHYPALKHLLLLRDGDSNSSRHYVFKEDLQILSDKLGMEIRIAYYPPHTSNYNPIEHRLFLQVSRSMQGMSLMTLEQVRSLIEKIATKTRLKVFATILDQVYETGHQVKEDFKPTMAIVFDSVLPQWNYVAKPHPP